MFLARRGPEFFYIGAVEFTAARDIRGEADGVDDDRMVLGHVHLHHRRRLSYIPTLMCNKENPTRYNS